MEMTVADFTFHRLTTERMILRQLEAGDAEQIFQLRSDKKVNQYLDRPVALTIEDGLAHIHKIRTGVSNNEFLYWAMVLKDEKKICGTICLWNHDQKNKKAEIGFELLPAYHGRGLMCEAVETVINYAFTVIKLKKIIASTHRQNIASLKLLEKHQFVHDKKAEQKEKKKNSPLVIYSLQSHE